MNELEKEPISSDNKSTELKNKTFSGVFWKFMERILAQGITFIVSMILARILSPDDYGVVAIITIFVSISDVFISSGFVMAIVRKKEVTDVDLSSVFYTNLFISLVLYGTIFIIAPTLSNAYQIDFTWYLRIIALKLPVSSLNSMQCAIVSRNMEFKKFFFATLIGTVLSAIVGIVMAYRGFGVWAIIAQQLVNLIVDTICLLFIVHWFPKLKFSFKSIKNMFSFSSKNMLTDLTGTIFNQLNSFIIGLKYSEADLAYYSKGQQLPSTMNTTVTSAMTSVLFSTISKVADSIEMVKRAERKSLKMLSFVLFPVMVGLAMVTKEFVLIFYTEKWSSMIFFMQIMCLDAVIGVIGAFDILTLRAIGKTNVTLVLEFIKKPLFLLLIFIAMQYGVKMIAILTLANSLLVIIIDSIAIHKYTGYNLLEKIKDCLFPILASSIMALAIFGISFVNVNIYIMLLLKIVIGVIVYLSLCIIFKNDVFKEIIMILRKKVSKKGTK